MSIANRVAGCETSVAWFVIEDNDDGIWRYARGPAVEPNTPFQVVGVWKRDNRGTVELVRGNDGVPILHQDDPGLPSKIVARFAEPVWGEAGVIYEYEQE